MMMKLPQKRLEFSLFLLILWISSVIGQDFLKHQKNQNVVAEMQVICNSDSIVLKMNTNAPFNGMVYAREAPNNANCVGEYTSMTNMTFRLPLKSCGTLFTEVDDGIEYFNTVVVQPHMRLMTNQGKGYHIRCKYQTRERTIANTQFNVSASFLMQDAPKATTPILATAPMPSCTMKIFRKGRSDVAEAVKIGDKLVMIIEIDHQEMYGMRVSNCFVRDGLNMAEQLLIDYQGCPLDPSVMPAFEYSNNFTRAAVPFPAHKFPHTSSVYYQCNVNLCINNVNCAPIGDCRANSSHPNPNSQDGTVNINSNNNNNSNNNINNGLGARRKRFAGKEHPGNTYPTILSKSDRYIESTVGKYPQPRMKLQLSPSMRPTIYGSDDMSFDVYSGLYVSDSDVEEETSRDRTNSGVRQEKDINLTMSDSMEGRSSIVIALLGIFASVIALALICQICQANCRAKMRLADGSNGQDSVRRGVQFDIESIYRRERR